METVLQREIKLPPFLLYLQKDARHSQILLQLTFLIYGIFTLGWADNVFKFLFTMVACLALQAIAILYTSRDYSGLKSAFISSLSLCLMLKVNAFETLALAALLSIGSKYVVRWKGKHIFNPTNFGILTTILISGDAWLSSGQWGNDFILIAIIAVGGLSVLLKVGRLDASITFLLVFALLNYIRQVVYLGWEWDVYLHSMSNGTLLLFTFFMITDPKSTPNSTKGRIIWSAIIAIISFFLTNWFYVYAAPLWALFLLSPCTVFFDRWFVNKRFSW